MHEYTVKGHDRRKTYYGLAIFSGGLGAGVGYAIQRAAEMSGVLIGAPSGLLVFGFVCLVFDVCVWRLGWVYRLGLVRIPDLQGKWKGYIETSPAQGQTRIPCELTVHQTYTTVMLRLETEFSVSRSRMASLEMTDPTRFELHFEYLAEPNNPADPKMAHFRHYGVTHMTVSGTRGHFKRTLEASYYTEGDRDTSGRIVLDYVTD